MSSPAKSNNSSTGKANNTTPVVVVVVTNQMIMRQIMDIAKEIKHYQAIMDVELSVKRNYLHKKT